MNDTENEHAWEFIQTTVKTQARSQSGGVSPQLTTEHQYQQ